MLYNDHFDEVKTRMEIFWARGDTDRCSVALAVAKEGTMDLWGSNYYYDTALADRMTRERIGKIDYQWESIPWYMPYWGTAGIAEYAGCKGIRTPRTTWFEPCLGEPDASGIAFVDRNAFENQLAAVKKLTELAAGDYAVTVTDNCGIADALAAMRGTDELMMDMITDSEFVTEGIRKLIPIYRETEEAFFDAVKENNEGSILSWMHLWAPKRMAQMQCDLSVMISPDMFRRFVLPELEELSDFLDYPVYHFDGQEQRRHLDMLLSVKKLRAIQWTHVAGQPRTTAYLKELLQIQQAGKNLILYPETGELELLLDTLSSRGLHLVMEAHSAEEAEFIKKTVITHSRVRD